MTERQAAACGCSDEDRMAEIMERVEVASWDRGPLIALYVASSWLSKAPSAKWMARIFRNEFVYKSMFSLSK